MLMYRHQLRGMHIFSSNSQARPGRTEQEEISHSHVTSFQGISVSDLKSQARTQVIYKADTQVKTFSIDFELGPWICSSVQLRGGMVHCEISGSSSLPSTQSVSPSHTHRLSMHRERPQSLFFLHSNSRSGSHSRFSETGTNVEV